MAKKFLTGLTLVNLPSDPSVGSEGELYFNTSASVAKIYKEGAWSELGAGGGAAITVSTTEPASPNIGDAWYKNDTGEFYVYDGTYWVEVNGVVSITQEQIQDYVAPLFTNATNTNVIATYDDANNVINLNTSGSLISVDSITYPDYIVFDTSPETSSASVGTLSWDSGESNLSVQIDTQLNVGIGQEIIILANNGEATTLNKGEVVRLSGAQGQRPKVTRAYNLNDTGSALTIGIAAENITAGGEGFVVTQGVVKNIDTDAFNEGDILYLSASAGVLTTIKPQAPNHYVFVGVVLKKNASSGRIYVKPQNGYELDELHNVFNSNVQDNQALVYNSSASLWYNESIVNSLEGTANEIDVSASVGNLTLSLPSDLITPGDLTVTGNLTVSGSTTFINTETLNIEDNIILLNSNVSGSPSVNAGIEIERGSLDNVSLLWNETSDKWTLTNNGTTSYPIATQNGYTYNSVINIRSYDGITDGAINLESYLNAIRLSDDDGVIVTTGSGSSTFIFNNSGELEFPDASIQDTAFLGMSSYITDNLPEGSVNLYFTDARARTALSADLGGTNGGIRIIAPSGISDATLSNDSATRQVIVGPSGSGTYVKGSLSILTSPSISDSGNLDVAGSITSSSIIKDGGTSSQFLKADGSIDSNTYLTSYTETDPVFSASDAAGIDATDISNWNTAYGWGNHASAGYALSSHNHTLDSLSNVVITGTPSDGQAIVWDTATSKWVNETVSGGGASYPDQTGNSGKFLQTNGSTVSWQNVDFTGYLTESSASTIYLTQASASTTYLTAESDTLETVTDRGASSTNAITITNATAASSTTTGALIVSGGVGIGEDLYVNNDVYIGGDINITGSISGSLSYINVTDLVVTDPLIYLAEGNPNDMVDIGTFGAYNHSASIKYHTGLIRDASDSGKWKLASNLLDPTSNVIDFTGATFDTLKIGILEVTDASTTRTNLGLAIGTDVQAYNSTLASVAGGTYSGDDSITTVGTIATGTWNGSTIGYAYGGTGLTSLGSAGYVLAVNGTATGLEWVEMTGGGGSSFTNSSELAALLSDETGSGSAVFSSSPTFTGTVTIPNLSIGGQALMQASSGSTSATSSFDTTVYSSAEFIVYGSTSTGNYVSKVLMLARGSATPVITEYAILTQGTAPTVTITPSYSAPNAVLTVSVTSGTNIEIIATEVSI